MIDSEPQKRGINLCLPEDPIRYIGKGIFRGFYVGGHSNLDGIGLVIIAGRSTVSEHPKYLYDGKKIEPIDEQVASEALRRGILYGIGLERTQINGQPYAEVDMYPGDLEQTFSSQMLGGDPTLPEEAYDFVEQWQTRIKDEQEVDAVLLAPPDAAILSTLRFQFRHLDLDEFGDMFGEPFDIDPKKYGGGLI